jgi:hypothetical protein
MPEQHGKRLTPPRTLCKEHRRHIKHGRTSDIVYLFCSPRPQFGESWSEICGLKGIIACGENNNFTSAGLFVHHNFSLSLGETGPSRRLIRTLSHRGPRTCLKGLTCKFFPYRKNRRLKEPTTSLACICYVYDLHFMTTFCSAPLLSSCQAFMSVQHASWSSTCNDLRTWQIWHG